MNSEKYSSFSDLTKQSLSYGLDILFKYYLAVFNWSVIKQDPQRFMAPQILLIADISWLFTISLTTIMKWTSCLEDLNAQTSTKALSLNLGLVWNEIEVWSLKSGLENIILSFSLNGPLSWFSRLLSMPLFLRCHITSNSEYLLRNQV